MPRIPEPAWRRTFFMVCLLVVACLSLRSPEVAQADSHIATGQDALVETDLLLRAAPSYEAAVVMPVGSGTTVNVVGESLAASDGSIWYEVNLAGEQGFLPSYGLGAPAGAVDDGNGVEPAGSEPQVGESADPAVVAADGGEPAVVTSDLNLRAGPNLSDPVVLVMPAGARVTQLGNIVNGFLPVDYNGTRGWAYQTYLDTSGSAGSPQPAPSVPTGASAVTTADLNLRGSASLSASVVIVMPAGATVAITGASQNGFTPVTYGGQLGWAYADYLSFGGGDDDGGSTGETGAARVTEALNFRTGPSTAEAIITVMPAGATVTLTGNRANGYLSIAYNGSNGWAYAAFLASDGASPAPTTPSDPVPDPGVSTGAATTTAALNLRAGPSTTDTVLVVIPDGAGVSLSGNSANGFLSVSYGGVSGWAYGSYLTQGESVPSPDPGPAPGGGGGSGIAWPVQGGSWQIIQGYNGGTHQNRSASAQYYYALDIAQVDGNTAGAAVLSPVTGTIRWVHAPSGGIAIDMGNGYAVAMFHATFAANLSAGQTVQQGQYLGTISGRGGNGYASTPHLEIDVWRTGDGGITRASTPFTGGNAIGGLSFPDVGGGNQHGGSQFNP